LSCKTENKRKYQSINNQPTPKQTALPPPDSHFREIRIKNLRLHARESVI